MESHARFSEHLKAPTFEAMCSIGSISILHSVKLFGRPIWISSGPLTTYDHLYDHLKEYFHSFLFSKAANISSLSACHVFPCHSLAKLNLCRQKHATI